MPACQAKPRVPAPKMIVKHVVRGLRTLYQTRPGQVKMTEPTKLMPEPCHRESIPSEGLE
jgi:hypothetical protein